MEIGKILKVHDGGEWRNWLNKNCRKEKEIWLHFYKKSSGKQKLSISEAVDEALCFGWIDSTEKGVGDDSFVLRFSPRRLNSYWSDRNKEKVRRLITGNKMTKYGMSKINWLDKSQ